ncbi:MAG TPA: glycosyltransferase [Candidatus Limnocylindria bacterium]|nr:glycosyltransferase [Candidatus Limnocylindria bacterium]
MTAFRVSAVLTCYNAAWCIERALDSVIAQTRAADEILVSDDGSTDDTVERIVARYGDRVRVLRLPHCGLTPSRRAAVEAATGNWIALLDADDEWLPNKLASQVGFLERHPEVRWLTSDGPYLSEQAVIRESWLSDYFRPVQDRAGDLFPLLIDRCFALVSSALFEARAYHDVGGFDVGISYSQDYDLWLRLAARYPAAVQVDSLVRYYSSPGQLSRRIEERFRDDLKLMRRVANGALRRDAGLQRLAAERAAALEFDLGVMCLRSGRIREGRVRLMRAAVGPGPIARRALAIGGAMTPNGSLRTLMRSPWIKGTVQGVRGRMPDSPNAGGRT